MLKFKQRIIICVITIVMLFSFASFSSASVGGGTYKSVTYTGQAVDSITFNSVKVNAIYSLGGGYGANEYSCAALVMRFYKQVYGFDVWNLSSSYATPVCSNGKTFNITTKPRIGDIVRFQDRTHWALVKAVNGNTVTIMEQNWGVYTSMGYSAPVNRTVQVGDSQVSFFTYSGYLDKSLQGENGEKTQEIVYDSFEKAVAVNSGVTLLSTPESDNIKMVHEAEIFNNSFGLKIK